MDSKQMAFAAFTGEEVAAGDNSKAFVLVQQFYSESNFKSLHVEVKLPNLADVH